MPEKNITTDDRGGAGNEEKATAKNEKHMPEYVHVEALEPFDN